METSLHRELKRLYAGEAGQVEFRLAGFRIDAVVDDELVEIQHGPLAAIRDKVRKLLATHRVRVVKPIVASKQLIVRSRSGGRVTRRRASPKHGQLLDVFDELIHFTNVFPHPRLTLEVPLVSVEEWRVPGHGRRRWRRPNDLVVEDQKLVAIEAQHCISTLADLVALVACPLPKPFHTGHLAEGLSVPRWLAQRIAYCLRHMGAASTVGKQRNSWLYDWTNDWTVVRPAAG
jgi:hypothetical protein